MLLSPREAKAILEDMDDDPWGRSLLRSGDWTEEEVDDLKARLTARAKEA